MARRLRPEARREEIVEVADALIASEGYRSLSLREVARRCGMSAPGLMHHFPDMPSLLRAVLERRDTVDLTAIMAAQPVDARLEDLIEAALRYYMSAGDRTRRYDALEAEAIDPTHPAHDFYLERDARTFELLRPALEHELADPDRAFAYLKVVFDGLRFRLLRDPEHVDIEREWHAIRDLVLGSIERRDRSGTPDALASLDSA